MAAVNYSRRMSNLLLVLVFGVTVSCCTKTFPADISGKNAVINASLNSMPEEKKEANPTQENILESTPPQQIVWYPYYGPNDRRIYNGEIRNYKSEDETPISYSLAGDTIISYKYRISDLSFLENEKNIIALTIRYGAFSDLSPLANLTGLEELELSSIDTIEDISPLAALTNIEILGLNLNNHVTDISALTALSKLKDLAISSVDNRTSLSPIFHLEHLYSLSIEYANENSGFELSNFKNLEELYINGSLTSINALSKLTALKKLKIPIDMT